MRLGMLGSGFRRDASDSKEECDQFYDEVVKDSGEDGDIARQSYAGLLWTKQFYHYVVADWREGDPGQPPPDRIKDVISAGTICMPAIFSRCQISGSTLVCGMGPCISHVADARVDPQFAQDQLVLLREWYMHPNGQMPAYEWAFEDVNPPVHAWACLQVYEITGKKDHQFLAVVFRNCCSILRGGSTVRTRRGKIFLAADFSV